MAVHGVGSGGVSSVHSEQVNRSPLPLCKKAMDTAAKVGSATFYILNSLLKLSYYSVKFLAQSMIAVVWPEREYSFDEREAWHIKQVQKAVSDFKRLTAEKGQQLTLEPKKNSHLWRPRTGESKKLDLTRLNRVIRIDSKNQMAHVQGGTTMRYLTEETLKHGLLPKVVPELLSITVGGGTAGMAVESSSFKHGLFHHMISEMEVLTGKGEVRVCTKDNENRDLFHGLPNSYGTLGYILSAKIELVPVKPYVKMEHLKFNNAGEYFSKMRELCLEKKHDFIDGAIFAPDQMVMTLGTFVDEAPFTSNYCPNEVYYKSMQRREADYLKTPDYIKRWDTDLFWATESNGKPTFFQSPWFRQTIGRALLRSDRLYKMGKEVSKFFANVVDPFQDPTKKKQRESLIQDIGFPIEKCAEFYEWFKDEIGLFPIFICPFTKPNKSETFPLWDWEYQDVACDFGFFSSKHTEHDPREGYYNRKVEEKTGEIGGRKSLYSRSFYEKENFERIYCGGDAYSKLKRAYDPGGRFPTLFEKCVQNR